MSSFVTVSSFSQPRRTIDADTAPVIGPPPRGTCGKGWRQSWCRASRTHSRAAAAKTPPLSISLSVYRTLLEIAYNTMSTSGKARRRSIRLEAHGNMKRCTASMLGVCETSWFAVASLVGWVTRTLLAQAIVACSLATRVLLFVLQPYLLWGDNLGLYR